MSDEAASSRWRRIVISLSLVLVMWIAATACLFVWPFTKTPTSVDAVVVLSGDHGERLVRALQILDDGLAPTLVLAGSPDTVMAARLCGGGKLFEVVCLRPDPDSTRAEARATGALAAERGWDSMIVVTSTQHLARAGVLFDRCFGGALTMVGARPAYGWRTTLGQIGREWLGLARALVIRREC